MCKIICQTEPMTRFFVHLITVKGKGVLDFQSQITPSYNSDGYQGFGLKPVYQSQFGPFWLTLIGTESFDLTEKNTQIKKELGKNPRTYMDLNGKKIPQNPHILTQERYQNYKRRKKKTTGTLTEP